MTQPPLIGQMERLLPVCQALSKGKLKSLMGLSDSLASLNHTRYSAFSDQESGPAGWMFDGPAHRAFNIASLSSSAQDRAQTVVLTLSGLYGVLRTTDEMRPYRLEMGSKLPTERGSNLYDYWGEHVSACIVDLLRTQPKEEQFIVNCASQEYYKVVNLEALDGIPVYTIKFSMPSVYAKQARGYFARFMAEENIRSPQDLSGFQLWSERSIDGVRFELVNNASPGGSVLEFSRKAVQVSKAKRATTATSGGSKSTKRKKLTNTEKV